MIASELTHLEKAQANDNSDTFKARLHAQGERPGGLWSKLGKSRRPRDLIHRLKIPNATPPQYERHSKKMSQVARDYHENLQNEGLDQNQNPEEHKNKTKTFLNHIPDEQRITEQDSLEMNRPIEKEQVKEAIATAKSGTATGTDGCPYELWKKLASEHETRTKKDLPTFDITQTLTDILTDIQINGIDPRTNFTLGWMCPIYKKKDPTEISNYRPIATIRPSFSSLL